ncbi:hypothetical protein [Rubrivirga sp.]|uniref:hypothetical protein n=1 Tax=Rubrivirga sp. TaxID=1885344 RepID=UPI003C738EB4
MTRSLFVLTFAIALVACDSSSTGLDGNAPPPLPAAAFELNADAFPGPSSGLEADASTARLATGANYLNAAARVGIVSTVVGLNLVLPVEATRRVTRDEPTVEDGVWTWERTTDVLGTLVDLELTARADGSEIDWRLTSTVEDGDPFTFYTATTDLSGETGSWRLFNPDEAGSVGSADLAVLEADFDVRDLDDREVTFSVPNSRDNGGSTVLYRTDDDEQTFDWLDQPEDDRALIVWDLDTREGSIVADTYNSGERACWDSDLEDVEC